MFWGCGIESVTLDTNAVVAVAKGAPASVLTYRSVYETSTLIKTFLEKHFSCRNVCIGLHMSHNVYIPSILISLQELKLVFMFLPDKNTEFEAIVNHLGIVYVLTLTPRLLPTLVDSLCLELYTLFLFKTKSFTEKFYKNMCYIIQTSGTTGEPQFVRVGKNSIESNIKSLSRLFNLTQSDVIHFSTPLTFDPSMIELGLALHNSACLVITQQSNNTATVYNMLFHPEHAITMLQIVPSLFLQWSRPQIENILSKSKLKVLAFGGEAFPVEILEYTKADSLRIFNLYGITEMSCWAAVCEVKDTNESVSVGEALDDTLVEVRDEFGGKIERGEGEIYIGSERRICLIGDEDKPPEFRATGDIGCVKNKQIYCLGRRTDTFKRFGHKLHLTKIQNEIKTLTSLDNRCIWSTQQAKLLVFFQVDNYDNDGKNKILDKIRVKLLHGLPQYSLPDFVEIVPKFPVNKHGKLDTKSLELVYLTETKTNTCDINTFKSLLCKYLGLSLDDVATRSQCNFFEIGGNSILAIQLLNEFGADDSGLVKCLFENTIAVCFDMLSNVTITNKRHGDLAGVSTKKKKLDFQMKVSWRYNLQACVDAPPLLFMFRHELLVAVGSFSHIFAILNASTGEILTHYVLPDVIESSAVQSPCENFLYVGCFDGKIYCLAIDKVQINWTYSTDDRIKSSPILCQNDSALVFGSYDKNVHCISTNGASIWKSCVNGAVIAPPLLHKQKIYTTTLTGSCYCLTESKGAVLWRFTGESPIFGGPCLIKKVLLLPFVQNKIVALSLNGELKWSWHVGGFLYSSISPYNDDSVVFGCHDCNLYLVEITDDGTLQPNKIQLSDKISTKPSLCTYKNKSFIVAPVNGGRVFLVDISGFVVGEIALPKEVFSSATVYKNRIYVGCRDNNMYCIDIE